MPEHAPLDPALFATVKMRRALAGRDIGGVYRLLKAAGVSQREIARRTGQSQSEVSEILAGRQVRDVRVLERIADGLDIPRELVGLAGAGSPFGEVVSEEDVKRRYATHLLAMGAIAAFGGPVRGIGELAVGLPVPAMPTELPSRVGTTDVATIRGYTDHLLTQARRYGGQAGAGHALAEWADQWLAADATNKTHRALLGELSELHTVAGYCCSDSGAVEAAYHHFGRGVELATDAGDGYRAANALRHAAMMIDRYEPNNALKLIQLGQLRLGDAPRDDPRVRELTAWLHVGSAFALANLDRADLSSVKDQARSDLARSRDGWEPPDAHAQADMDLITAMTLIHMGQLDTAEAAAVTAARVFRQGTDRREGVIADTTVAQLHVQTGEPDGLRLAATAIDGVAELRSAHARQLVVPLAAALEARPGGEARELAGHARRVAAA